MTSSSFPVAVKSGGSRQAPARASMPVSRMAVLRKIVAGTAAKNLSYAASTWLSDADAGNFSGSYTCPPRQLRRREVGVRGEVDRLVLRVADLAPEDLARFGQEAGPLLGRAQPFISVPMTYSLMW
jgi:hypothetical protein